MTRIARTILLTVATMLISGSTELSAMPPKPIRCAGIVEATAPNGQPYYYGVYSDGSTTTGSWWSYRDAARACGW